MQRNGPRQAVRPFSLDVDYVEGPHRGVDIFDICQTDLFVPGVGGDRHHDESVSPYAMEIPGVDVPAT